MLLFLMSLLTVTPDTPPCFDFNDIIFPANNKQILVWKKESPNQYLNRGHIIGVIGQVYPEQTGHTHFQAIIDDGTIEIIYNNEFGKLHDVARGNSVEACGDFINSNRATSSYPASPDGAILHWLHISDGKHLSGYLKINENIYGHN